MLRANASPNLHQLQNNDLQVPIKITSLLFKLAQLLCQKSAYWMNLVVVVALALLISRYFGKWQCTVCCAFHGMDVEMASVPVFLLRNGIEC